MSHCLSRYPLALFANVSIQTDLFNRSLLQAINNFISLKNLWLIFYVKGLGSHDLGLGRGEKIHSRECRDWPFHTTNLAALLETLDNGLSTYGFLSSSGPKKVNEVGPINRSKESCSATFTGQEVKVRRKRRRGRQQP